MEGLEHQGVQRPVAQVGLDFLAVHGAVGLPSREKRAPAHATYRSGVALFLAQRLLHRCSVAVHEARKAEE